MQHEERRIIKHSPNNLYNLVADVKKYPEFLPWCLGARIKNTILKLSNKFLEKFLKTFKSEIFKTKMWNYVNIKVLFEIIFENTKM